ncbi:hypothetical protein TAMA11512_00210 [Selenomonas sp. TAMA-11512]|uniref:TlpA family protein disulfide reductase n=1 Tax=Selenomonas sp. TAMA-11512 TaxID=3095337 RepID=UPI0030866A0A|nr:hypothetical protein TAMA11512_00210 [Selenomonas sp. TAMA-11512]
MKSYKLLTLTFLLLAALSVTGCSGSDDAAAVKDKAAVRSETVPETRLRPAAERVDAPPIQATTMDGAPVTLDAKRDGKIHIINFWATWCPPCRAEMPELDILAGELKNRDDVAFYAVNLGDNPDTVHRFLVETGLVDLTILLNQDNSAARQYAVQSIPTTILIDADGKLAYRQIGMTTAAELKSALDALKEEDKR